MLLCKEAVLDIYEELRRVSVHKTSVEFENVCGLFVFCFAGEVMFQMEEYKFSLYYSRGSKISQPAEEVGFLQFL